MKNEISFQSAKKILAMVNFRSLIITKTIFIVVLLSSCNLDNCPTTTKNYQLGLEYSGIISRKFIDSSDRDQPRMIVNNNKYPVDNFEAFEQMNVGDTITKTSGTLKYFVKSRGSSFSYYPKCGGIDVQ